MCEKCLVISLMTTYAGDIFFLVFANHYSIIYFTSWYEFFKHKHQKHISGDEKLLFVIY